MHRGTEVAIAVWAMTAVSLTLATLRLYTRVRIVKFVGVEDYLYASTGLFLLVFAATLQVAVYYGLGRSFWALSLDSSSQAILWTYIANTFAITGNAMAKLSMGFFLLRVVQLRAQKAVLWLLIVVTAGTSFALVVMLWNQTTPVKASWDPLRTPGVWNIQIQPMSVGLGGWSSACDFFFAIFPWMIIWSLRMPRRDKIILAGGMSLGVIAGACGIIRTVVLSQLEVSDYTYNFALYFVWAGAEIAVAMICLGIPTLRPLYLRNRIGSTGYGDRGAHTAHASDPELPQFTMCDQKPLDPRPQQIRDPSPRPPPSTKEEYHTSEASSTSSSPQRRGSKNGRPSPGSRCTPGGSKTGHARTTSPAQSISSYMRDSGSSHTMVEPAPPSPEPPIPAKYHTPTRPANVHMRLGRSDSVDDIVGLYNDERSRSRGGQSGHGSRENITPTPSIANSTRTTPGVIWVQNEVRVDVEKNVDNWPLRC
ncbi:hypothetical protein B0T22DRAFT_313874 [Podospora appendiculata]|uniref:Rhodopsin domain-containing protein n=1 Tax=Podospora appendiculata TaxID=314037 RepID=A0AAE0WZ69_9PEZI|nr:hypothetical protein B0T22DRAFT_313874 [Podospora appendiculata]